MGTFALPDVSASKGHLLTRSEDQRAKRGYITRKSQTVARRFGMAVTMLSQVRLLAHCARTEPRAVEAFLGDEEYSNTNSMY
jgi:hypothetical protein